MLNMRRCLRGAARKGGVFGSDKERARIPTPPSRIGGGAAEVQETVQGLQSCEIDGSSQSGAARPVTEANAGGLGGDFVEVDVSEKNGIGSGSCHRMRRMRSVKVRWEKRTRSPEDRGDCLGSTRASETCDGRLNETKLRLLFQWFPSLLLHLSGCLFFFF